MTGTIFLGGTARRKSSGARSRFPGACQDQHTGATISMGKKPGARLPETWGPGPGAGLDLDHQLFLSF